jgi:hypothetical protein
MWAVFAPASDARIFLPADIMLRGGACISRRGVFRVAVAPPPGFGFRHLSRHIRPGAAGNSVMASTVTLSRVGRSTAVMAGVTMLHRPSIIALNAVPPAAIPSYVRIQFIRFPGAAGNITPQGLGLIGPLLGLLPKAGSVNLRLLRISTRTDGLGLALAGIDFHVLGFTPDLGGLFPVFLVAFLLHGLAALSAGQKKHHNQRHHNNGNYHPYPWSCIHVSHHFPLRCDRAGPRHSG